MNKPQQNKNINDVENSGSFFTSCKDCYFAEYLQSGQIQNGCRLGRLQRFQSHGGIEQVNEDDYIFYKVKRYCTTLRSKKWAEQFFDPIEQVKREISLKHSIVGIYKEENDLEQLLQFVNSCLEQTHLPLEIVVLNEAGMKSAIQISKFWDSVNLPDNVTFKNIYIMDFKNDKEAITELVGKIAGTFFSLFQLPYYIPPNFIKDLNVSINERLERWIMLTNETFDGFTFQTKIFNRLKGNEPVEVDGQLLETIYEKIMWAAKFGNEEYLIKDIHDIVVM